MRGSTVAISGSAGKVTDRFAYDVYGKVTARSGRTDTEFLYCGAYGVQTDGNGLLYMRARYYSPELMRFLSEDTVVGSLDKVGSLNRYAFCGGNPVGYIDPSGNDAIIITSKTAANLGPITFGHTSVIAQNSAGDWFYYYWGNKNVILEQISSDYVDRGLDGINEWLQSQADNSIFHDSTGVINTPYTSIEYFGGDFTETVKYYEQLKAETNLYQNKNGEWINKDYSLTTNNCLQTSIQGMYKGILNNGLTFEEYNKAISEWYLTTITEQRNSSLWSYYTIPNTSALIRKAYSEK